MRANFYFIWSIFLLYPFISNAQLCNGTLGDPIFIETFGAGTGAALPAGSTTYSFTTGWPTDGQYTIANTSNPPPGNPHWYTGSDHTGNSNGYMFIVNASYAPGEFFKYTVSGLCSNTTYVFSAWLANVNNFKTIAFCKDNDPPYVYSNVLFKVQNLSTMKIDSISTGSIVPDSTKMAWRQYGFTFSTGPGQSSVVLTMVNNGKGGCGNDLVIDDISFRACGPSTSIDPVPFKQIYCSGDSILLDAKIGAGYNNPVYQWQFSSDGGANWSDIPGETSQDLKLNTITPAQTGKYRLILAENGNINLTKCRIITDNIGINIKLSPVVTASAAPSVICKGETSTLTGKGTTSYTWSNGTTGASIQVNPLSTQLFTVTGTDTATGCISKASVPVTVNSVPDSPVVTGPDSICSGNIATFIATAPGGVYNWYDTASGGTPIFIGDSLKTSILTTTKTYYVESVSPAACASYVRTPVTVIVHQTPVSPVVIGPDTICAGKTITLEAIAPGGIYKWYDTISSGTPLFTGDHFQTPNLDTNITYYVEVTTISNCSSVSRTPVNIVVHSNPISPVIAGSQEICSGNSVALVATAPGGTYYWYDTLTGGTPIFIGDHFITPVLTKSKTYYVEVKSEELCFSVSRTPVKITVNEIPISPVVVGADSICARTSATLKATAPGGIYKWYDTPAGGFPIYTGNEYHSDVLTETRTYYVEAISEANCVSSSRTPVTVTVSIVDALFSATPSSGTAPLTVDFINTSKGAITYYWNLQDNFESTLKNVSHVFSSDGQGGIYEVMLIATNSFGCKDTMSMRIAVNPFSKLIIPNIFTPNGDGVNDIFTLGSTGVTALNAQLFDRWGLKLFEWNTVHGGWDGRTTSGGEASEGTYYYIIIASGVDGQEYKLNGHLTLIR